jgi:hypothetical protein
MKVYTYELRTNPNLGFVITHIFPTKAEAECHLGDPAVEDPRNERVQEYELLQCPTCQALGLGTRSCDRCGQSHCDACSGTDSNDQDLCLACATKLDTIWGKFYRLDV